MLKFQWTFLLGWKLVAIYDTYGSSEHIIEV